MAAVIDCKKPKNRKGKFPMRRSPSLRAAKVTCVTAYIRTRTHSAQRYAVGGASGLIDRAAAVDRRFWGRGGRGQRQEHRRGADRQEGPVLVGCELHCRRFVDGGRTAFGWCM